MLKNTKYFQLLGITLMLSLIVFKGNTQTSAGVKPNAIEEEVTYTSDTVTMKGFIYSTSGDWKRSVILVVHEWWGLNDYPKSRAKELAGLAYLVMAVDIYGNGKTVETPAEASAMSAPFYQDPMLAKARFDAALAKIKAHPLADTNNIAAIGFCFGGGLVLNVARMGENLKGVVSFHGNLLGVPADEDKLKASVLVCHGEDDKFVKPDEVAKFKKQMDSVHARYTFKSYPNATHAFTNPAATATGKKYSIPIAFNEAAEIAAINDMLTFLGEIFK